MSDTQPVRGRFSLRTRLLVLGLVAVAVATVVGGVALYEAARIAGTSALRHDAQATSEEVAELVRSGRLPNPIPVAGAQVVQVLDAHDRVVSASADGDQLTALVTPAQLRAALRGSTRIDGARIGSATPYLVVASAVSGTGRTVVVAEPTDQLARTAHALRLALVSILPVLLLVLGLISWRLIGATLRPVERLRAGAERISGSGHDERLPVPRSVDEVHALATTLNSMLDRLAASRLRQRDFLADVAHELRSPLASMRTQLEVAQQLGEGGDLAAPLLEDVIRMSRLVEDLTTVVRLDGDEVPLAPAVAIRVDDVVERLRPRYAGARVAVDLPSSTEACVALGPGDLDRLLGNLLDNAVRHARSRVVLTVGTSGARVQLSVDDDGPGIPAADRGRMLERFTRLDAARARDDGGSGLGLAIVAALAGRRGGSIGLLEAPLGGLRARLDLPGA